MYENDGLGQTLNLAIDRTAQIRALQYKLQQQKATPSPWPTVTATPTTFRPTTTPVLIKPAPTPVATKPATTTVKPTLVPTLTTPKPVAPSPVLQSSGGGVSMAPAPSGSIITETADMVKGAFGASPLPLIAIGIAALFLLNRKGR